LGRSWWSSFLRPNEVFELRETFYHNIRFSLQLPSAYVLALRYSEFKNVSFVKKDALDLNL
jgi:hypothetical protein